MPRIDQRVEAQIQDPWDYFISPPGKGTGSPVAARVDPEVKHMISMVVQSGRTKFDTENDFIRSAISWFLYDKFKKFHEARLDLGVQTMMLRIRKAQHQARVLDIEKFKNVNCDALTKMWAIGAETDALGWFGEMLDEARSIHERFGREVYKWAMTDPRLTQIRLAWDRAGKELAAIEEDEEKELPRPRAVKGKGRR